MRGAQARYDLRVKDKNRESFDRLIHRLLAENERGKDPVMDPDGRSARPDTGRRR
ncbi:MAG TPA: hypothetical protein PKZ76_00800 [Xanthomonadaceae bacterium]|nr:hypothetical protein [Xanthomonadaceae bacterium]